MADLTPQQRAQQLLDEQQNLVLATVGADAVPWISPLFYVPDVDYELYWTSDREARHSINIRANGRGAIVAYAVEPGRPVDGVYAAASITELEDPAEVAHGIEVMARRSQPAKWVIDSSADVTGDGPWRIYRAHLETIEVRTSATRGDKAIAARRAADFR